MADRFDQARRSNQEAAFRIQALDLLERIAIALENRPDPSPMGAVEASLSPDREPYYNSDANVCNCGNDPKRACSQCTPARMAWFYNMNPGWEE
jgi:hypothetical protein